MKYKRRPTVRPGELHAYWGKDDDGNGPAIVLHNASGTHRADAHFLHSVLNTVGASPILQNKSFVDELVDRGYDITTLRFYIKKKDTPTQT